MRLIHNYIADIHLLHILLEEPGSETLRRDIKELEVTIGRIVKSKVNLTASHSGVHAQCLYAAAVQVLDLVFHQRDKRCDDNCDTFLHKCRNLEAD